MPKTPEDKTAEQFVQSKMIFESALEVFSSDALKDQRTVAEELYEVIINAFGKGEGHELIDDLYDF
jgi:hypothetical protein